MSFRSKSLQKKNQIGNADKCKEVANIGVNISLKSMQMDPGAQQANMYESTSKQIRKRANNDLQIGIKN